MDTSTDPSTSRRESKHGSSGRALPRRPTRGPLDINETPISSNAPTTPLNLVHQSSSLLSPSASQYATPRLPSPQLGSNLSALSSPSFRTAKTSLSPSRSNLSATQKDFSFLLRPEIYHPLTLLDVPPPFRVASAQPDPSAPLSTLISQDHFRSAAIKAAQQLTSPTLSSSDHEQIFNLIYTRLSCLTLCNQTTLASQEVKALEDLNSSYYRDDLHGHHLVPWELRVLAIRLQGMGFNDARRGIMGYYDLTREVRLTLSSLKKSLRENPEDDTLITEIKKWTCRLEEMGIRLTSSLIEMEDFEGATRFLALLKVPSASEENEEKRRDLEFQKALLWLCLGDVEAARLCISSSSIPPSPSSSSTTTTSSPSSPETTLLIHALSHIADSNFALAVPIFEDLITLSSPSSSPSNSNNKALYTQNLAVTLLYLGHMDRARALFENLIEEKNAFHALTFNLCTVYELCTERSRALKIALAERVAGFRVEGEVGGEGGEGGIGVEGKGGNGKRGWEKVNGDFKL